MKILRTPVTEEDIAKLHTGDMLTLSGKIYCGRDAVLPRICRLAETGRLGEYGIDLRGSVIFHTAVSPAGVGPTSSNKLEIEESIPLLSRAGVKIHLGKGALRRETVDALNRCQSVFAVIPPVTALLGENMVSQRCAAFPELGMEAFYELTVKDYPMIIAAAHNESIY
ncbi:MAG: fumarate hydratase C-terminal domain-containing protein [bacterium]|nr:fumarate hydratase C-terminal domain-containing protein [bacterium]